MNILNLAFAALTLLFNSSITRAEVPDQIFAQDGKTLVQFSDIIDRVKEGDVIFVSENHGIAKHHAMQKDVIRALIARGFKVNMGIEHFSYLEQNAIDAYLRSKISEDQLVKTVGLSGFENWRDQMWMPLSSGGWSYGLNAPRWLTDKILAVGIDLLSPVERSILPSDFTLGNSGYKERFKQAAGVVHPTLNFERTFMAQSAWDDTSAMTLASLVRNDPHAVFVVLFGDFHVIYGGGLPDRFHERSHTDFITVSQVCREGFSSSQLDRQIQSNPKYGQRADFIVTANCLTTPEAPRKQ